ncbi:MAG TPA: 50S ribosomal protein L22 [Methanoregulaceae archaeon]|nr:50S ribosomal protein L22 [Methanoregulaceae archaeon]
MAKTKYSKTIEGENVARGKANEIPVSPKHAMEIARFIKNKRTDEAIAYLEEVVACRKAIPFRKFNRNVAHKRGLSGWDAGRYPKKASEAYIRLLHSVNKNAEYIGLDTENLKIVHVSANCGRGFKAFFPRAMGRATPKRRETVNIEIMVREVE